MKKTWFDRAIEFLSPTAGLRRMQSRIHADIVSRHYEAAAKGRRTNSWRSDSMDSASVVAKGKKPIREIARDLARNNAFAVSALDGLTSNVIGTGVETVFRNANGTPNKRLTDEFKAWAESTDADFGRCSTYFGLQELAFRSTVEGGEALILPMIEGGKEPRFCLRALEPDFVDDLKANGAVTGTTDQVVDGVVLDSTGRKKGLYIFKAHPGSALQSFGNQPESVFIPSEDVFQVFRMERIGQLRGISWFAPVITMLKELDELFDATLLKQKIASAFAGYIVDHEGISSGLPGKAEIALRESIEPGALDVLGPGKDIRFPSPPAAGDFDPFTRSILRAYSAGMKIPYEVVTGDLSQVNFSSGRMGWQEFGRKLDQWQWNMLVPMLCRPVAMRWLQFQAVKGARTGGVYATFVIPKRAMVDPVSETNAINSQIRMGTMSLPDAIRAQGEDPNEKIKEIAEFNKKVDELGLVFDSDPRKITKSGIMQAPPTSVKDTAQEDEESADQGTGKTEPADDSKAESEGTDA